MIYLAHYALLKEYPEPHFAISNDVPRWALMEKIPVLAPKWTDIERIKKDLTFRKDFVRRYWRQLKGTDLVYFGSFYLNNGTGFCWERPGDFCHRRVLAAWLHSQGYQVTLDGKLVTDEFSILGEEK